jgi:hypothetical protein
MVGPLGNLLTMRAAAHLPRWLVLAATSAGWVVPMRQCGGGGSTCDLHRFPPGRVENVGNAPRGVLGRG